MGGRRLEETPTMAPMFAVVGEYARPAIDQFVGHVALLRVEQPLDFGTETVVWHCSPPIIAGETTSASTRREFDRCQVHAISFLDDLSVDDVAGMQTVLAEIDVQTQPVATKSAGLWRQYVVHPPVQWVTDATTGRKRFRKFSCVGFVCECYEQGAGIRLLDLEGGRFPAVDLKTLVDVYGDRLENERIRERFGVVGPEPWPIALAGYAMHSLSRAPHIVRHSPHVPQTVNEAAFPVTSGDVPARSAMSGRKTAPKGRAGRSPSN